MRASRWLAPLFLAASACSADAVDVAQQPIVGGGPSDAGDDEVVLILTHDASKDAPPNTYYVNCTGTLLAPNVVLTARHCISATTSGTFTCKQDGSFGAGTGGKVLADYPTEESHVFVGAKLPASIDPTMFPGQAAAFVHDGATVLCNSDVALIVLAQPIPGAKIAPIRLDGPVTKDEVLTVVGWGATETAFVPPQRQRREGVTVVDVGPSTTAYPGGQLADKEFLASESVCSGDSGGPAFDAKTGAVVGVVSRGPNGGVTQNGSGCVGTQHTFMMTAPFKDLVLTAFQQAGGEPWIEGKPAPGQGTGGSGGGGGANGGGGGGANGGGGGGGETSQGGGCAMGASSRAGGASALLAALALAALRRRGLRRARERERQDESFSGGRSSSRSTSR